MGNEITRWEQRYANFRKALNRLAGIVNLGKSKELDEFERDSMVKRFEFTFECAWRVMKGYAEYQGVTDIGASRDSIRQAFKLHLIENPDIWMEMIKWRNETSHNYNGDIADNAIDLIQNTFYPVMISFCSEMEKLTSNNIKGLFKDTL